MDVFESASLEQLERLFRLVDSMNDTALDISYWWATGTSPSGIYHNISLEPFLKEIERQAAL